MRGVAKGTAPSGDVAGGSEPLSWIQAQKRLATVVAQLSPQAVRDEHFDTLDKAKLRPVLLTEQRHLCVYCERLITAEDAMGVTRVRIAHWTPILRDKTRALDWKNIYASCDTSQTCDQRQASRDLHLPVPAELRYEQVLDFRSDGVVQVRADTSGLLSPEQRAALLLAVGDPARRGDDARVGDPRSPLNLNHPALCAGRAAALDGLRRHVERRFPGRTVSAEQRLAIAADLLARPRPPAFVSVQLAWLERRLRRPAPP